MKTHPIKNQRMILFYFLRKKWMNNINKAYFINFDARFNYDECHHPIKYSNPDLAKN